VCLFAPLRSTNWIGWWRLVQPEIAQSRPPNAVACLSPEQHRLFVNSFQTYDLHQYFRTTFLADCISVALFESHLTMS
jgi:hypothetical protein